MQTKILSSDTQTKYQVQICEQIRYTNSRRYLDVCVAPLNRSLFSRWRHRSVSDKTGQFEDIQDVISRYKLLVRTRKDLQQSQEKDKEMIKQTKVLLDRYEAEKEAETLQYQNELEQLHQRFAQAQSDVRSWTARWADIQNRNAKNALMLTTMKTAIHNLFQCVNK
ncbi:coiled-coil domain-containing protein 42-like [Columba livia]|uniref:coiled-coil domain-containing protein 42-like n=1 Tax=Columba livia TaxID=8932 RepID=UPI0031BAF258